MKKLILFAFILGGVIHSLLLMNEPTPPSQNFGYDPPSPEQIEADESCLSARQQAPHLFLKENNEQ